MRANSAAAIVFQETIANEILPAIRKHGMYLTPGVAQEAIDNKEEFMARAFIMARETIDRLKVKNAEVTALAEFQAGCPVGKKLRPLWS